MVTATTTLEAMLDARLGVPLPEMESRALTLAQARAWLRDHKSETVLKPERNMPCGGLVARGPGWRLFRHRGQMGFTLLTAGMPR